MGRREGDVMEIIGGAHRDHYDISIHIFQVFSSGRDSHSVKIYEQRFLTAYGCIIWPFATELLKAGTKVVVLFHNGIYSTGLWGIV